MKKSISIYSLLLFIVPVITLTICHQLHVNHTGVQTIPFLDGKVSVSLIGRQEYSIGIFKPAFFSYALISIFFYFKISDFFLINGIKNKFKIYGILANFFLCIYIIALGQRDSSFYEILRRLAIIFYITNMYINHIYLIKILKLLKSKKIMQLNVIYLPVFYIIISLMTILIIIGLPWVNPLFKYPDQLKNIVEWNYFLLTILFYIPVSLMFYQLKNNVKK
jgi:hypothetical protein